MQIMTTVVSKLLFWRPMPVSSRPTELTCFFQQNLRWQPCFWGTGTKDLYVIMLTPRTGLEVDSTLLLQLEPLARPKGGHHQEIVSARQGRLNSKYISHTTFDMGGIRQYVRTFCPNIWVGIRAPLCLVRSVADWSSLEWWAKPT